MTPLSFLLVALPEPLKLSWTEQRLLLLGGLEL